MPQKSLLQKIRQKKIPIIIIVLALTISVAALFFYANYLIPQASAPYIFKDTDDIPKTQAALILGSKVYANGDMSDILTDRVIKGLELYNTGKVSKLLISGDHGRKEYDEVNTVKNYLLKQGIPEEDIFLDHAGFDTYDSLYRAKHIFNAESVTIVTQEFHLPRAVYIGNSLGIKTYGVVADRQPYIAAKWNSFRESLARVKAFIDVTIQSKPKFLGEQIPITGSGKLSWD